ncbi:MAG: hypothetical protein ABIJ21_08345 [Nanoarchaeota archaeon]
MYSWGPDTTEWRGKKKYSFDSARSPYLDSLKSAADKKGPRAYTRRASPGKLVDPRGKDISSDSENPLIVAVDVTGSMATAPGEFFDRAPLLYQTLSQYKTDLEICFGAIGDATCDNYPLQVNSFGKGLDLEEHIKAIGCEGGGGGQISESYELFGHFILNHCTTPKAKSPFLFIYGDEKFYDSVNPDQVKHYIGDKMQGPMESDKVWKGLMQRFNVYLLQKPYGHGDSGVTREVKAHWAKAIGPQRIIDVPSPERTVDVIMGIVAKTWGRFGDFKDNLDARQDDPALKDSVYASIRFVGGDATKSTVTSHTSRKTTSLSEMYKDAKDK